MRCVWLEVGREGGEWMRGLGLGFTTPVGTAGVCICLGLRWCRWGVGLGQGLEEWGGVMSV